MNTFTISFPVQVKDWGRGDRPSCTEVRMAEINVIAGSSADAVRRVERLMEKSLAPQPLQTLTAEETRAMRGAAYTVELDANLEPSPC